MKNLAELHKSLEKNLEKMWHFVVCFDALVVGASSSSAEAKLTTKTCHNFQEFLDEEKLCPANFLKQMIKENIDQHKILVNFHLYRRLWNFIVS